VVNGGQARFVSTLRQKPHAGCGPVAIRLPGSTHWRFRPRDLDAYARNGEISPETLISAQTGRGIGPASS
jgi:hypothetical protein